MRAIINGQSFVFSDRTLTVSKSVGIYECEFEFDDSWQGWDKTAVFEGSDQTIEVVVSDGKAQVPWEVLTENGLLKVGVYGTKEEKIMPTVWSEKLVVKLGTPPGSIGSEPTPSIYAQILHVADEAKEIAEGASDTADEAKTIAEEAYEKAETAQDSARSYAEAAHGSAQNASASASSAATSATNAANSANEAHGYEQSAKDHADDAEDAAERAEQSAAVSGYMFFYIDENGDLIYQRTSNVQVDFALIDGDLYVGAEG